MTPRLAPVALVLVAAVVLAPRAARAGEEEEDASTDGIGITYDLGTDVAVTAGAAVAFLGSEWLVKKEFALEANWSERNGLDTSVRDALVWKKTGTAFWISYVTAGAAPVVSLGLTALAARQVGRPSEFWVDALLVAEATALDGTLNQLVKFAVRRQRPCAGSCPSNDAKDDNLSFYSEHASLTFALAASAGTVARLRGYPMWRAIWLGTAVLGAATAYLRIAANEHYLTDVVTGAAMGTAVGVGVPYWFHRQRVRGQTCGTVAVLPIAHGGALTMALRW